MQKGLVVIFGLVLSAMEMILLKNKGGQIMRVLNIVTISCLLYISLFVVLNCLVSWIQIFIFNHTKR